MKKIRLFVVTIFLMILLAGISFGDTIDPKIADILASGDTAKIQAVLDDINKKLERCQESSAGNPALEEKCSQYLQQKEHIENFLKD